MWKSKSSSNKKGSAYILLETLVSIAILSLGLVLVINAFSSEINALRTSKNYTHASLLLEEKVCELEKEGEIDVDAWRGKSGSFFVLSDPLKSNPQRKRFDWQVDIDWLYEKGSLLDIVEVTITVGWNELNIHREVKLITYMPRKII